MFLTSCCSGNTAFSSAGGGAPGAGVDSFNGRNGVVVAANGDYNTDQVTNGSGVPGATCSDALDNLATDIATVATAVTNLDSDGVANVSSVDGATVTAALDTLGLGALLRGADLSGSATNDLTRALGSFFVMMPGQTTGANTINLQTTGLTSAENGFNFVLAIYDQAHAVAVVNKGPLNNTLMTVPAGELRLMFCQWDGLNFALPPGWSDLEPL